VSYAEKNLVPGESIVHRARYHWVIYRTALLLLLLAVLLGGSAIYAARTSPDQGVDRIVAIASLAFLAMAVIAGLARWISASAAEFVVTNRRVIRKAGLFAREIEQAPLDKIQDITVAQGVLGRLLNFGTVTLETASERGTLVFPVIDHPEGLRNALWGHSSAALAPVPGAESASPVSAPERLKDLESLKQRGLVSEEEYAAKRRDILSRL